MKKRLRASRRLVSFLVPKVPEERPYGDVDESLDNADYEGTHHDPFGHLGEKGSLYDPAEAQADNEGYERGCQPHP